MVFYLESWGFSFYILPYTSYDCVCYQSPVVGRQREKISNEDLPVFLVLVRGQNSSPSEFWALAQLSLLSPLPLPLVLVWHCQRAKAGEKEERKKKKKKLGWFLPLSLADPCKSSFLILRRQSEGFLEAFFVLTWGIHPGIWMPAIESRPDNMG